MSESDSDIEFFDQLKQLRNLGGFSGEPDPSNTQSGLLNTDFNLNEKDKNQQELRHVPKVTQGSSNDINSSPHKYKNAIFPEALCGGKADKLPSLKIDLGVDSFSSDEDVGNPIVSDTGDENEDIYNIPKFLCEGTSKAKLPKNTLLSQTTSDSRKQDAGSPKTKAGLNSLKSAQAGVQNNDTSTFGLGEFDNVIVTDGDLDRIRQKLNEEEAKTQQQIIRELRERLLDYKQCSTEASSSSADGSSGYDTSQVLDDVCIIAQFYTLGYGSLSMNPNCLLWRGCLVSHISPVDEDFSEGHPSESCTYTSEETYLVFPSNSLSDMRVKVIDGDPIILTTLAEDLGIGFVPQPALNEQQCNAIIDKMKTTIKPGISAHFKHEIVEIDAQSISDNNIEDIKWEYMVQLVESGLELIKSNSSDPNSIQVNGLMHNSEFRNKANKLVERFVMDLNHLAASHQTDTGPICNSSAGQICNLCFDNIANEVLNPCAHRVCSTCLSSLVAVHKEKLKSADSVARSNSPTQDHHRAEQRPEIIFFCPWDRSPVTFTTQP
ncbi:hypothetical protein H4219_001961 [Mycoemilia scoparia]|uniref:RING-type domain-containing protein n=1 Tax=Mycoemilia scoparia TaxID=417184 RepID=A0A9W8DVE8_9FUNG|nr:hypothetical protein H4219_001961 [Mycoemilia scoparia]